jgi:type IV secretion system protein VirB9
MKTSSLLSAALAVALNTALAAGPAHADPRKPPQKDLLGGANTAATRQPEDAARVGALHEFAFERGALYAVTASPERITDIVLEPGEALLSVSAGDTTRWIVGDAHSGTGQTGQAHVLVKPNAEKLATNLVVMTDRRVYHIELTSLAGPAMAEVSWRYPADLILQNQPAPGPFVEDKPFSPAELNFRYKISGDSPEWRPHRAFDDGHQVFIEMPDAIAKMEAPPLFVIGDDGAELVNYRVQGHYYVVDRLFAKAELRLGASWKKKTVRIDRTGPLHDTAPIGGKHG